MRRIFLAVGAVIISSVLHSQAPAEEAGWLENYDEARALARKEKRPLLINFTGSDWCRWCVKLEKEVLSTPEFKAWAKERVVLLKIDFPTKIGLPAETIRARQELKAKFNVKGFPAALFVDSESEAVLGRSGYLKTPGPAHWTETAQKILDARTAEKKLP